MTTACSQTCYANMSPSANTLPIINIFNKFCVRFLGKQLRYRDNKVPLVVVNVSLWVLYLDFKLAQRHLNHWKLPSEG